MLEILLFCKEKDIALIRFRKHATTRGEGVSHAHKGVIPVIRF
jgi:hypothetical protein